MFLVRFLPAVFVFGLAALGYCLTAGGTRLPEWRWPKSSGRTWFVTSEVDEYGQPLPAEISPDSALLELFRFDANPNDLGDRWKRQSKSKTAPVYQAQLQPGDLAIDLTGSVLYHFGPKGRLKRVVLAGTTTAPNDCGDYAQDVFSFKVTESKETVAVLKGEGTYRGHLRIALLTRPSDSDDEDDGEANLPRYRVEWTVER